MPFPHSDRVIYGKNPLRQVICQVRFPSILRIESEVPADYQEQMRGDYPLYRQSTGDVPEGVPPEIARIMTAALRAMPGASKVAHQFQAENQEWAITLTAGYLALSCNRYTRWEEFRCRFTAAYEALRKVYEPPFLSRVGLRYQDVIVRSEVGLPADTPWRDLLTQHVAGELGAPQIGDSVARVATQAEIRLGAEHTVKLRHGTSLTDSSNEEAYSIDSDFYSAERTEPNACIETLDRLHEHAGRLFRWCITERLHAALDPGPVE